MNRFPSATILRAAGLVLSSAIALAALPPVARSSWHLAQIDPSRRGGAQKTIDAQKDSPTSGSRELPAEPKPLQKCPSLERIRTQDARQVADLIGAIRRYPSAVVDCDSVASVVASLVRRGGPGGRRLEPDRAQNVQEARAELQAASRQPGVRTKLDRVVLDTGDDKVRLVYEAAILDEYGFYKARDLKIQELRRRVE